MRAELIPLPRCFTFSVSQENRYPFTAGGTGGVCLAGMHHVSHPNKGLSSELLTLHGFEPLIHQGSTVNSFNLVLNS